jgi:hypothetical protein
LSCMAILQNSSLVDWDLMHSICLVIGLSCIQFFEQQATLMLDFAGHETVFHI